MNRPEGGALIRIDLRQPRDIPRPEVEIETEGT
jgi:hypothetical protein